jgi:hypothetical protein
MSDPLKKYPRTRHIEGSRFQEGDEDLESVRFREVRGKFLVVEEKLDGANTGISFDDAGELRLQSRGHFLTGGGRERHFALLKTWAGAHRDALHRVLGSRYVLYGEWLYAKHTVFYDRLPHYFFEFDILDTADGTFLSTARRREMLAGTPVTSVPVIHEGPIAKLSDLEALVKPSLYKSATWRESLDAAVREKGLDVERARRETDLSDLSEGLYIKVEEKGAVTDRLKWVRSDFLQTIAANDSHWQSRPIIPNGLAPGVDLFTS